ncbi:AAA family ATPase [Streptomyces poonensis]|uniref:AAA family ATPase n=1 Tax=Streptomyces poonensis TaxID=68255 RepID=UPI001E46D62F|nr:LuxR family transcriptional regulator [Streptomyces poonensis]
MSAGTGCGGRCRRDDPVLFGDPAGDPAGTSDQGECRIFCAWYDELCGVRKVLADGGRAGEVVGLSVPGGGGFVGRRRERELLARVLESARTGAGGSAVLLRGEAGIGKTALLEWTEARARGSGFQVLRAVGAEADAEVAFAALHEVLLPLLPDLHVLPTRQREALECALRLREGAPAGGFLVGAAALTLLAEAARDRPLLVVVDDLHWVDSSSAQVLAFLHRRVGDVPVAMVAACRPGVGEAEGWPAPLLEVGALAPEDAGTLLRSRHPGLAAATAHRLLSEAAGNPLALVELPAQLDENALRGIDPLPDGLPLGQRLERVFADRLEALSPDAARVLLLAALGGGAAGLTGTWLQRVAGEKTGQVLRHIETIGLARLDSSGRLVFRHPLMRSAVLSRATEAEKRRAHRTLAAQKAADDPRRLVHEASAATGPDEDLARELQQAGQLIAARGGDAEGALLLDRAAALSAGPADRASRLTWAAVMAARGGRLAYTARLVRELRRSPVPDDIAPLFAYAVVYVDQSHRIEFESSFTLLPAALDALTEPDAQSFDGLVEQVFFKLLLASAYTGDPRGWRALDKHLPHVSELARLCHRAWSDTPRTAHGVGPELAALADRLSEEQEAGSAWLLLWTASAVDAVDHRMLRRFTGQYAYATQGSLAKAKCHQDYLHGRWEAADDCLREAEAAADLGYHCNALLFRHYHAHFLAGRGDEEGLRQTAASIEPVARAAGMRFVTDHLEHLRGMAALAHGRHEEAYTRLAELSPPGVLPTGLAWFQLPFFDFVDAAVHTGRWAEARAHVAAGRTARMAELSGHHAFLLAAAAAFAAPDEEAEACYREACAVPGADRWVFPMARLRLVHGVWLRRHHRAGARDLLREAHQAFVRLGATPWAERCAQELRAAGDRVGTGTGDARLLTGQELRIATLAATGLSNKEIGRELGLSPRTVATHLYKVFPKLGITSRAALAQALREGGPPEPDPAAAV